MPDSIKKRAGCVGTRVAAAVTASMILSTLAGCGLLGGSEEPESGNGGKVETTDVTVSIMKTNDLAPFHLAMERGYFKDEGLNVKPVDAKSSDESTNKVVSGEVEIAYSSLPPFFLAESKKVAQNKGGIKLVADSSSASAGSCIVVASPSSKVKSIRDMAGKRVAVTGPGSVSTLLTQSTLKTNGIDYNQIKWVPTPYPQVASVLKNGNVDAAFVTEPFIQDAMKNARAEPIFDTAVGPTADMPLTGWAATGDFAKANPKTIAAFQRAMQRATQLALSDRTLVEKMLVKYSGADEDTAKMSNLVDFQSKLDATRLQRVPDLMLEFGIIKSPLKVGDMMVPTAPLND